MRFSLKEYSAVREVRVLREGREALDYVIAEEPLEIRLIVEGEEKVISTTMRTPGADAYLAVGYLKSEGLLSEILNVSRPTNCSENESNQILISVKEFPEEALNGMERRGVQSSSCGLCGKNSLSSILGVSYKPLMTPTRRWTGKDLENMRFSLTESQPLFKTTGGSHAVWLCDESNRVIKSFEDVGRHNALDKLLGWVELEGVSSLEEMTLIVSSRLSYELVHKAATLGISVLASVGAPTSLAVELANMLQMTTVGFLKKDAYNLYSNKKALIF